MTILLYWSPCRAHPDAPELENRVPAVRKCIGDVPVMFSDMMCNDAYDSNAVLRLNVEFALRLVFLFALRLAILWPKLVNGYKGRGS